MSASLFAWRFWRLYRYFRSGGIYRGDPRPRLNAVELAWAYARKGWR